jgi:drug/metabolite transporter (DMT)-like permease
LLAVLLTWVAGFVVLKLALRQLLPMAFNFSRFVLMVPLAFVTLRLVEGDIRIPRRDLAPVALSGVLGFGAFQVTFIGGLDRTSAAGMALLMATVPVFSALMLAAARMERLSRVQWLGILVALAGVASFVQARPGGGLQFRTGDLLALVAGASFAAYSVLNKPLVQRVTPLRLMAYGLLFGLLAMAPFSVRDVLRQDWGAVSLGVWVAVAWATVFPIYLAYILWNWAIARQGVARTVLVSYFVPVLAGVAAHLFLAERLTPGQIGAGVIVLGGVALARLQGPKAVQAPAGTARE